jgi:3D (Asp-Asp-Asp) domain-containing protein
MLKILLLTTILARPMEVTAYCPCEKCCGQYADGITASGYVIQQGDRFVAAPKNFKFGVKMIIPNYGVVEVKDRGGAIKGNKLDVYFDTHEQALQWGRQNLIVYVLEK